MRSSPRAFSTPTSIRRTARKSSKKTILHGEVIERLLYKLADTTYVKHDDIPFYKKQKRVVLETSGNTDAEDLDEYLAHDGYAALEKRSLT